MNDYDQKILKLEKRISELEQENFSIKKTLDHHLKCINMSDEGREELGNLTVEFNDINKKEIYDLQELMELVIAKVFPENQKYREQIDKILKGRPPKG